MQKNSITNKITPCCGLPFSVVYWWVKNLTLNSEADRDFIISKLNQNGTISIEAWKVLAKSATLEADASFTKADLFSWFDCGNQPSCEKLKIIIEGLKVGNWTPETELPLNNALVDGVFNGVEFNGNVYTKTQTEEKLKDAKSGVKGIATQSNAPTPYTVEAYPNGLFESWKVIAPITSPNNWGNIAVTAGEIATNTVFFNVTNGVVTKELSAKVVADPAKLPLYSAIKGANIVAGTQFIDDENGFITYRVKTGQTLLTTETPAGTVGVKVDAIGGSTDEIYKRNEKITNKTNNALTLGTGTNLTYSDATVGNLGTAFSFSVLAFLNGITAGTILIASKGDYATDGWGLFINNQGLNFTVNGANTIITKGVTANTVFISIVSSATDTKIYGWGKLVATLTATTTTATALKINPTTAFTNDAWIHYVSIDSRTLTEKQINNEKNLILTDYAITDLSRDFVGNTANLTTTGYKWKDRQFAGTAVIAARIYPTKNLGDGLYNFSDTSIANNYLNNKGVVNVSTVTGVTSIRISDYINVENYTQLEVINAIENSFYFNGFYDANYNPILLDKSHPTNSATTVNPLKTITLPLGTVYARVMLANNGYVRGVGKVTVEKPKLIKDVAKEAISIERVAPVLYDGIFDSISSQTPTTVKLFTVASANTTEIVLSQTDIDTFSINGDLYPLAIKDSTGKYHFANVIADKANLKLTYEKPVTFTAVKFMSVYDTTLAQQGQHLSHYGGRALAERIVQSVSEFQAFKNLGSVGFVAENAKIYNTSATDYKIIDGKDQVFCELKTVTGVAVVNAQSGEDWNYRNGFSLDSALSLKGSVSGLFATFENQMPTKTGFLEAIIINPLGTIPTTNYVAVSTVNCVIENNGVEVYNQPLKSLRYEKILLSRTDWGVVKIKLVSNTADNFLVFVKSILFFKVDTLQKLNPITSSSVVAVIADSWGQFPVGTDPTIEAGDDHAVHIKASDGLPDGAGQLGYMPKMIATRTGAIVDNWSIGGMTAAYGYSKMWDILNRKRYTHIVIGFFTNDNNLSTHRDWEGYIRLMVKMCVASGVQPIVVGPMGTASINQKRSHGLMSNVIRRGIFEAL